MDSTKKIRQRGFMTVAEYAAFIKTPDRKYMAACTYLQKGLLGSYTVHFESDPKTAIILKFRYCLVQQVKEE